MPFVAPKSSGTGAAGRATFRPPWVKDETDNSKPNTVPWAKKANNNSSSTNEKENGEKTTKKATAAVPTSKDTATKKTTEAPKKIVEPVKKTVLPAKKTTAEPIKTTPAKVTATKATAAKTTAAAAKKKEPTPSSSSEEEETEEEEETSEEETEEESEEESDEEEELSDEPTNLQPLQKAVLALKSTPTANKKKENEIPAPPPLPSLVPKAPPPPPPPFGATANEKRALSDKQKATLDKLKTRPRRRPDWSEMMKEVETGRKLRHVECNDRSQPILTCKSMTKVDDKFIYETEKDNSHNKLLKQIQGGIRLKPTQTNDRSKPILDGLRKFRRQMTIEEQLQKSQSKINMLGESPAAAGAKGSDASKPLAGKLGGIVTALSIDDPSGDELDDIDKLRDDLQSTKQMLALELRNREAQERENKKLLAKIVTLEAELEREKSREKNLEYGSNVIIATMDPTPATDDYFVKSLKREAEDAKKVSKDLENKYLNTGELLDQAKLEIEEQKQQIKMLEKKLAQALQVCITTPTGERAQFGFYYEHDDEDGDTRHYIFAQQQGGGSLNGSRRASEAHAGRDSSPDLDLQLSESDPDEPEEKKQERRERRLVKEVKILRSKLTKLKVKQEAAKKEKQALKQAMKKNHVILKEENKKYKKLEKEVQKMAASMKDDEDDEDADDDEKEAAEEELENGEAEEEEESEEESEESESEESGDETASESEAEDASNAAKKDNLEPRVKKHETRLTAMKKCNVLLQANVDNLQDEITQVRSKAANLQSELDAVLADLGF